MVPEVGREASEEVRGSIEAMREFTARLIASGAETVIIISPHAPLEASAFVAYQEEELHGDFANFRAPEARVAAPLDEELLAEIARVAASESFRVVGLRGYELDHGTAVPLYFLQRNGWRGRIVAFGYTFLSNEAHLRFGNCIKRAAESLGRRVAFVASGDLSHRLKPEAPAGYQPQAHLFDEEIINSVRNCAPQRIIEIDPNLRTLAGECGYRSLLVALGATEGTEPACEVLHYEAPFGVGYLTAQITRAPALKPPLDQQREMSAHEPSSEMSEPSMQMKPEQMEPEQLKPVELEQEETATGGAELPALARRAVETFIREQKLIERPPESGGILDQRAACFVSLKTRAGDLRGCIGTIQPMKATLAEELIANAVSAATRDPRFPPVRVEELPDLRYSVDVLHEPEEAQFDQLDPKHYGVIVEDEAGHYRGLLLPDLRGVETARQQVEIAARKAGIRQGTPLKLWRFRVERFPEPAREAGESQP
jgi:AmmeMemoRadiSam system protein A/AmmeMemoRadiSam system protein B